MWRISSCSRHCFDSCTLRTLVYAGKERQIEKLKLQQGWSNKAHSQNSQASQLYIQNQLKRCNAGKLKPFFREKFWSLTQAQKSIDLLTFISFHHGLAG